MSKHTFVLVRKVIAGMLLMLLTDKGYAQKYIFTHYDIEDGLIQSQVNRITEDPEHRIWVGTLGGACRFDGKEFMSLTKEQSLNSNFIFSVFNDPKGRLWIGSSAGLSVSVNNKVFNYALPSAIKHHSVTSIVQDRAGQTWLLMDNQLCKTQGKTVTPVTLPNSLKQSITSIATNASGDLYIVVYGKGIYKHARSQWLPVALFPKSVSDKVFKRLLFDRANPSVFFILAEDAIYQQVNGVLTPYEPELLKNKATFICMQQDKDFNLWIGTGWGAYRVGKGKLTHFNASNGFADQSVTDIFIDRSNNLWFGVGASGLYKYEGDSYLTFTNVPGWQSNIIVMGFARQRDGNILIGTDGFGVLKYNGKELTQLWVGPPNSMGRYVQSMHTDKAGNVWIGTSHGGLWKYDGKAFSLVNGTQNKTVNSIASSDDGTLWATTPGGVIWIKNDVITPVKDIHSFSASILPLGNDSVLIGGLEGLKLIVKKRYEPGFNMPAINSSAIYCMMRYGRYLLLGTGDRGVIVLDLKTRRYRRYTAADGLNSDIIYSITADKFGFIWVGTGRGVNRLTFNRRTMACEVLETTTDKGKIAEANQNAILYDNERIYIGNTKGLSIYRCSSKEKIEGKPHLLIQSIKVFQNQQKAMLDAADVPDKKQGLANTLLLDHTQNHIRISYLGIYLQSPASVYYQYKLTGLDSSFSQPVSSTEVDYSSLPPGNYTFFIRAGVTKKMLATETLKYSFIISPPFYQTLTFRFISVLLLVLAGVAIQYYYTSQKARRKLTLETIREQEKMNIRRQTAEDFHDDLGNKLTRISVLSDILDTKLKGEEEQQNLVKQIKQNVDALYKGTKDILWALDPKSDNLYEILLHVKDFGRELFEDTDIRFEFKNVDGKLDKIKLPMEYCRNLTMICKEILTNILKHAHAAHVVMNVALEENNWIKLTIKDDGKGFDTQQAHKGRGLGNINKRVKRINGDLEITSALYKGTGIQLTFVIPKYKQFVAK
ncbi:two-component regulator propeller domain-containing protein [Mucilaginibacter sp. PAMB04274]|uniref:ligand-binding sensor domain-containing protein n=1 Tax=Mucilaginibacter sp. PAMB04274 TaxID=3138568 RepID=UPI0031F644BA